MFLKGFFYAQFFVKAFTVVPPVLYIPQNITVLYNQLAIKSCKLSFFPLQRQKSFMGAGNIFFFQWDQIHVLYLFRMILVLHQLSNIFTLTLVKNSHDVFKTEHCRFLDFILFRLLHYLVMQEEHLIFVGVQQRSQKPLRSVVQRVQSDYVTWRWQQKKCFALQRSWPLEMLPAKSRHSCEQWCLSFGRLVQKKPLLKRYETALPHVLLQK